MEMAKNSKEGYGRFYALLRNHPLADKNELVMTYTGGRTTHLHEMKPYEYKEMCAALDSTDVSAQRLQLKKARSAVLLRLGRLGINTVDNWDEINAFCLSPKIAGKEFRNLSLAELQALIPKLQSIIRKGGLRQLNPEETRQPEQTMKADSKVKTQIILSVPISTIHS